MSNASARLLLPIGKLLPFDPVGAQWTGSKNFDPIDRTAAIYEYKKRGPEGPHFTFDLRLISPEQ